MRDFDVFIGYRNDTNREDALDLKGDLEAAGLHVWLDQEQIQPGANWKAELKKGLDKSRAVVILIGKGGVDGWHEWELLTAASDPDHRTIIVVLPGAQTLRPEDLTALQNVRDRQWIDCNRRFFRGTLHKIVDAIRGTQVGEDCRISVPGPFGERTLTLFTIPPRADNGLVELRWETFGSAITSLRNQILNVGTRLSFDACIGVNYAGAVTATVLAGALGEKVGALGYLRLLRSQTADARSALSGSTLPKLKKGARVLMADFEIKTGRNLLRAIATLTAKYPAVELSFAAVGALTLKRDLRISGLADLHPDGYAALQQAMAKSGGLRHIFIAGTMAAPGIEPPLRLR